MNASRRARYRRLIKSMPRCTCKRRDTTCDTRWRVDSCPAADEIRTLREPAARPSAAASAKDTCHPIATSPAPENNEARRERRGRPRTAAHRADNAAMRHATYLARLRVDADAVPQVARRAANKVVMTVFVFVPDLDLGDYVRPARKLVPQCSHVCIRCQGADVYAKRSGHGHCSEQRPRQDEVRAGQEHLQSQQRRGRRRRWRQRRGQRRRWRR